MKKIIMFFFMLLYLFSMKNVFAQDQYNLTIYKQDGIYFSRNGGVVTDTSPYYIFKFGDIYAYCIEPGKKITTYTYIGNEELFDLPISEELKEKLELVGYYGRDYPGHDSVRYSMATQALIWELTGVNEVKFWTGQNATGSEIDVTSEKKEIMSLVNNHKTLPNFPTNFYMYVKHDFEYVDTNNVLKNFEIVENGMQDVSINGNTLHIHPKTPGMYNIKLRRKNYNEYKTILFVGKDNTTSQKLARLHFSKEIETNVTISVDGARLLIHKIDEKGNPIKIQGITFKIKNLETGEYYCNNHECSYQTDLEGLVLTDNLDYGEYEIEEVENQIIPGYTWNKNKLRVSIHYDSDIKWNPEYYSYMEFNFSNQEVLGNIEIKKQGEKFRIINNEIVYDKKGLENIIFSLYDDKNNFIGILKTDSNGISKCNNLKVGKYYLIENTKLSNYVENKEKVFFEIKQSNQYENIINVKLTINNYLKKGTLEFVKEDAKTLEGIPNTVIEIYDENNNLLLTKITSNDGKVNINNLPLGKYYILEKKANDDYLESKEKVFFEIKDNKEIVQVSMKNEKITGTLNIIKKGEEYHYQNNTILYNKNNLKNIKFHVYDNNDKLISTLITDENGKASISKLALGKYYLKEENINNNYIPSDKYYFEIKRKEPNKNIILNLEIENYLKKGILEFTKEDAKTLEGIPDTIIEIYDNKNNLLFTEVTNQDGKVIINDLPIGKYYIIEKKANDNYLESKEKVFFEIKNNAEIVKTKMQNTKITGILELYKEGEEARVNDDKIIYEKKKLSNISFSLYDEDNILIDTLITDNNGYARKDDLPLGNYYLKENNKDDNYILDNNNYSFSIKQKERDDKNILVKVYLQNYLKKGMLEFTKKDSKTLAGIPNTIMEIYKDNKLLLEKKTDNNGKIILYNLPSGKYFMKEKKANTDYLISDEQISFTITENNAVVQKEMTNEKITGTLNIIKKGENYIFQDNEIMYNIINLEGVKFSLYDSNDKLIDTLITDVNGYASISKLPLGKYYLQEENTNNSYCLNNDKYYFEIKKEKDHQNVIVNLEIENYLKKGHLEFTKEDLATSDGIPNTIIEIYDETDNLLFTKETDQNGKIIIEKIPIGKYYIIEKEANTNYLITNEKVFFEIKDNNEIVKARMTNEKIVVEVPKTGKDHMILSGLLLGISLLISIGNIYYGKNTTY